MRLAAGWRSPVWRAAWRFSSRRASVMGSMCLSPVWRAVIAAFFFAFDLKCAVVAGLARSGLSGGFA